MQTAVLDEQAERLSGLGKSGPGISVAEGFLLAPCSLNMSTMSGHVTDQTSVISPGVDRGSLLTLNGL